MKKISIILLGILTIFFSFPAQIQAISVADFTPALDKKVAKIETIAGKVKFLKSFSSLLDSPRFRAHENARLFAELRDYSLNMLEVFEYELKEESLKNNTNNKTSGTIQNTIQQSAKLQELPHLSDNLPNVNVQKIREAILSWHNKERNNIWVNPYTYNLDLEWSATTWANNLAKSGKTKNLHPRNAWDWYYNYNSMLNRFSDLWINFPKSSNWGASFSETIWRNVYKCNKSDCTQDLINAIEKTWTWLIMKEKSGNGSHYRAATMKYFTQMWAWIAFDKNNRYYIVIHYGVEV